MDSAEQIVGQNKSETAPHDARWRRETSGSIAACGAPLSEGKRRLLSSTAATRSQSKPVSHPHGKRPHLRLRQSGGRVVAIAGSRLRSLLLLHGRLSPTERRRRGCCGAAIPLLHRGARMVCHPRSCCCSVRCSAAEWMYAVDQSRQSSAAGGRTTSHALLRPRMMRRRPRLDSRLPCGRLALLVGVCGLRGCCTLPMAASRLLEHPTGNPVKSASGWFEQPASALKSNHTSLPRSLVSLMQVLVCIDPAALAS